MSWPSKPSNWIPNRLDSSSKFITDTRCENINSCAISRSTLKRKAFPTIPAPRFTGLVTFISVLQNDFALRMVLFAPVSTRRTGVPSIFASTKIVDLALVCEPIRNRKIHYTPLFEDDLVIVVPPKHPLAAKKCAAPQDFVAENILLYPPKSDSTLLTKILEPAGIQPRKIQEVLLTEVILEMVIGGLGIAALPRWAVGPQIASGSLIGVPLQPPGYRWQWSVAQLRDDHSPVYVQEFIRLLAERPILADFFPRASRSRHRLSPGSLAHQAAAKSSAALLRS